MVVEEELTDTIIYHMKLIRQLIYVTTFFLLLIQPEALLGQNKIDQARSSLKANTNRSSVGSDDNSIIVELFKEAFLVVGYYSLIGDLESEEHFDNSINPYPYHSGYLGNYVYWQKREDQKGIRWKAENKLLMDFSNIYGNHFNLEMRPWEIAYLKASYLQLLEFSEEMGTSNLSMLRLNACYDRLRLERFNLGWTVGAHYFGAGIKKFGISAGIQMEYFVAHPLSVYASAQWGATGKVGVQQYELQLRYHAKNYYATGGFEHYGIGAPNFNFLAVGAGLYF